MSEQTGVSKLLINQNWRKKLLRSASHNENPIAQRKSVHITYKKKSNGRTIKRKIDPIKVKGKLLHAFDHHRGEMRTFHLNRILDMQKTAEGASMSNGIISGFEKAAIQAKTIRSALKKAVEKASDPRLNLKQKVKFDEQINFFKDHLIPKKVTKGPLDAFKKKQAPTEAARQSINGLFQDVAPSDKLRAALQIRGRDPRHYKKKSIITYKAS